MATCVISLSVVPFIYASQMKFMFDDAMYTLAECMYPSSMLCAFIADTIAYSCLCLSAFSSSDSFCAFTTHFHPFGRFFCDPHLWGGSLYNRETSQKITENWVFRINMKH